MSTLRCVGVERLGSKENSVTSVATVSRLYHHSGRGCTRVRGGAEMCGSASGARGKSSVGVVAGLGSKDIAVTLLTTDGRCGDDARGGPYVVCGLCGPSSVRSDIDERKSHCESGQEGVLSPRECAIRSVVSHCASSSDLNSSPTSSNSVLTPVCTERRLESAVDAMEQRMWV